MANTTLHAVTSTVRTWIELGRDNRLLYDHLPKGLDQARPPEIIAALRQLVREGVITKFVTCEDGIVWPAAAQEVRQ
ncbi:MAG TPA: hypothetical protein VFW53_09090 [Gallionella sp.]|nr:hypothetical protein [Gallionella sp.]